MQLARQGGATPGHSRGSKTAKPPRRRWFQPAPPIGQTILMSGSLWPLLTGQPGCVAGVCRASIRSARSRAPTRSSRRPGASCPVSRSRRHAGRGRTCSPGSRQSAHRVPRPPRPRLTGSPGPPHAWQISALSAQAPVTIPRTRSPERLVVSPTGLNSSRPSAGRRRRPVPPPWASRTVAVMRRRQPVIGSLYQPRLSFPGPSPGRAPRSALPGRSRCAPRTR